jgi:hypothetical protein
VSAPNSTRGSDGKKEAWHLEPNVGSEIEILRGAMAL